MSDDFKNFIADQLREVPEIRFRKMFGGFGIYSGQVFFGIISDNTLYFKTNTGTKEKYIEAGSDFFKPSSSQHLSNYYEVPVDILEDKEALAEWANESIVISSSLA